MAKYLIASYTNEGVKGVITKGGTARRDAVESMASDLGGRLESFYFAFGDGDAFATVELPDNVGAAAVALAVGASGMATARTTVLLTPADIDLAAETTVNYAPLAHSGRPRWERRPVPPAAPLGFGAAGRSIIARRLPANHHVDLRFRFLLW